MADEPQGILDTPEDVEAMFADEPTPAPEEQPAPEAEVTETPEPETPAEPQPQEPEAPAEGEPTEEPAQPQEPEAEARMWAGKYKSPEELENAYGHQVASATRLAQERAQIQRERDELRAGLEQARPLLEQIIAQQRQPQQPQVPEDFDYTDPQAVAEFVRQQNQQYQAELQAQMQQTLAQQQQQLRQQQEFETKRNEFLTWQQENPDVVPGTDMWTAMNNVIYEFQFDPAKGQPVEENFPLNRQSFQVAKTLAAEPQVFEMSRRLQFVPTDDADIALLRDAVSTPALADHLEANPNYLESLKGHSIARQLAGMPQAVTQAQQNAVDASKEAAEAQRRAAYVESDSPGTPAQAAPGDRPDDVWKEIGGEVWDQERSILNNR